MKVQLEPVVAVFGILGWMLSIAFTESASAQQDHHPVIAAFERFVDVESTSNIERGRLLINELNCTSCHQSAGNGWSVAAKQAPVLSQIGNRVRPGYFEKYLLDPHGTKPGTSMPDVLAGKSASEKKTIAEALGHFLASTGKTSDTPPLPGPVSNGEKLFHSIGCVACHNPQNSDTLLSTSIPLGKLADKYTIPGLTRFLQNPLEARPSGRMPHLNLAGGEAKDIATYLLKDIKVKSNINVAVYSGSWDNLPVFDKLKPLSTGSAPTLATSVSGRGDNFGLVFTGFWTVTRAGKYNFSLSSDDGSRLLIDGKRVIDNDGVHGSKTVNGSMDLKEGIHDVRIEYFEKGGGEELKCVVTGPDLPKQSIGGLLKATRKPPMDKDRFVLDAAKAKRGAEYFTSLGCANCHQMKVGNQNLASSFKAQNGLADLKTGGCLEGEKGAPDFGLNEKQRASLVAALSAPLPGEISRKEKIHQNLATFNCYACHERDFVGGVVDRRGESDEIYGRQKWFTSTQPEMGDEGRLPPLLTGVGAKLNSQWLGQVLNNGAKERPYMATRMPRFGETNLGDLAGHLLAEDKLTDVVQVEFKQSPRKIKLIGKAFAGTSEKENGLSCVKCHTFGKYRATGIQAISLTSMSKRLNRDWFQLYMMKPSRFRPGTRMPESWPGGKSFFDDVLDGDANKQIAAIWEYLADGEKAAKPKGLVQAKMQLVATDAPRIYRNFIEGAGSRAIGVGYPEEVNLAFDANNNRLAMIWFGAFIDASRHWVGRGQGYQPPLGDNVLKLPEGVSFALPKVAEKEWPKQSAKELGLRFRGYEFNSDRQPIFRYQLGDLKISDFAAPRIEEDAVSLKRTFVLESESTGAIWYRAASAKKITRGDDGTYSIGDDYQIRLTTSDQTMIRSAGDNQELLIKINLENGKAEFTQEYIW